MDLMVKDLRLSIKIVRTELRSFYTIKSFYMTLIEMIRSINSDYITSISLSWNIWMKEKKDLHFGCHYHLKKNSNLLQLNIFKENQR